MTPKRIALYIHIGSQDLDTAPIAPPVAKINGAATARKLVDSGYTYPFDEISNNSV